MEKLGNIFYKDINRPIKAAITVEDEKNIVQELEEYVVTEEMEKRFKLFFTNYKEGIKDHSHNVGVWISGFFGSGKSHFLKMLSYIIDNKVVNGKSVKEYFEDKFSDKSLLEDISEIQKMSSDVILFNIASQANNNSATGNKEAILEVFEKVFNEKLGLSTNPAVAEIERNIIKNNKFDEFKKEFKSINGNNWDEERNGFQFVEEDFVKAYSKVMNVNEDYAKELMDKTERNYSISIRDFAERVNEYIKSKGGNHQVVFLVDEVSLYIGNDDKLVLDLQTIVEDLGDICQGNAWVIATAQQAIDVVIKNVHGLTMSKMLGRFHTRIDISSTNIDEIIKERLLKKKDAIDESLRALYSDKHAIIKNLLFFKGGQHQREYEDNEDFARTYPMIPYQFPLLQDIFESIRDKGFAGISLAGSERTLISAVQEAVKTCADEDLGAFIPLYVFYNTAERELSIKVRNVINSAEKLKKSGHLEELDVNVLKTLFLLKNIKTLPSNIDNITALFVSSIDEDKLVLRENITNALKRLERQTLIQKNGDVYTFLTDDEQEVNREIKNKEIDREAMTDYLKKIILDDFYNDSKMMYKNQPFVITKAIDDYLYTNETDIGFKIRTLAPDEDDKALYFEDDKYAIIKLILNNEVLSDMKYKLQIEKYLQEQKKNTLSDELNVIISTKSIEMRNLEATVKDYIKNALENSEIIIGGNKYESIKSKDIKTRINEALAIVISNKYTKLAFIQKNYTKEDIKALLQDKKLQTKIANIEEFPNQKAYDEIAEYIKYKNSDIASLTIRTILQDFEKVPYGYLEDDILYLLAKALKDGYINLVYGNEIQIPAATETVNKLTNRSYFDRTTVRLRTKIDQKLLDGLKSISRKYFNKTDIGEDEDQMVEGFKNCLNDQIKSINNVVFAKGYYGRYSTYEYPAKEAVNSVYTCLNGLLDIKYNQDFFEEVNGKEEFFKENMPKLEKALEFFDEQNNQREIFDNARSALNVYDKNQQYIGKNKEIDDIANEMKAIMQSEEPYSDIFKLPTLKGKLVDSLTAIYDERCQPIIDEANDAIQYIQKEAAVAKLDNGITEKFAKREQAVIDELKTSNELVIILAQKTLISNIKEEFDIRLELEKAKLQEPEQPTEPGDPAPVPTPRKVVRVGKLINHSFEIDSEEDIDKYVEEIRAKLKEELATNGKLTIKEG
ncbi:MAG: BREX system P-loop protein BrxC [Clostridia bacterium]|nr:BREX system P-loop protein BrxC [Clostridia bacterium]